MFNLCRYRQQNHINCIKTMILPIAAYGSPVLRKRCGPADLTDPDLPRLISHLLHTMKNARGAGLAAPQINLVKRFFATEVAGVFINPCIEHYSEEKIRDDEGCLSIPGIRESVPRAKRIVVSWTDEQLQPQRATFEDDIARVVQHEYDHLNGRLYLDHLPLFRKKLLQHRLNSITRGKVAFAYPLKLM